MTTVDKSTKNYSTFDPRVISNCVIWLDAADSNTVTLSGSSVSQWNDKSVSANNAAPNGVLSTYPTYTDTQNGRKVISFSGASSQRLAIASPSLLPNGTSSFSSFLVGKTNTGSSYQLFLRYGGAITGTAGAGYQIYNFASNLYQDFYTGPTASYDTTSITNTYFVFSQTATTSLNKPYRTGNAFSNITNYSYNITPDAALIGCQVVNQYHLTGTIGEILMYNRALSDTERQNVEGYLAWKWGTQSTLPIAHPYIARNPVLSKFSPTDLSNCALWFDAADKSKITVSSGVVTAWVNKGSISVSAANFAGSCTSNNTLTNGLNYISCPAGAELRFTAALNTQARTWILVARNTTQILTSGSPLYWGILNQPSGISGQDSGYMYRIDATNYGYLRGPVGSPNAMITDTLPNPYNLINTYCSIQSDTTVADNIITLNGTSYALTTSTLASGYNTTSLSYEINTSRYSTGSDIFEILFFTRVLTASERNVLEGYLAWKWGTNGSLPSTHPFKNFPPLKIN